MDIENLYNQYYKQLHKAVQLHCKDPDLADDIVQETFCKVWESQDSFNGESDVYTWLYRIAMNTLKDHFKTEGRRPPTEDVDWEEADENDLLRDNGDPESQLIAAEEATKLQEKFDGLSESQKETLYFYTVEGLSYQEIADKMDVSPSTVRTQIERARRRMTE